MARTPAYIYAILAYSKSINTTKRIFDEDSLLAPYQHTTREALAEQKAAAFAQQLNDQGHKGVRDWVARVKRQAYRPSGVERGSQIISPTQRQRGW